MTEKEKRSLKIRLGQRLSHDKSRVMEIVKEEIDKTETTMEKPHGEWIIRRNKQGAHIYSVCSKCNVPHLDTDFPNFCENCGSDNRKKEDKTHGS